MFSNTFNKAVGFKSTWRQNLHFGESACQTDETYSTESETQTATSNQEMTQTEAIKMNVPPPVVDDNKLLAFLNKVSPVMIYELKQQNITSPFENFFDGEFPEEFSQLHSIKPLERNEKFRVSSLAWNATSSLLCVGFSSQHKDWCNHNTTVCIYRASFNSLTPIKVLEIASCITSVNFHLQDPSTLAGGTWAGELFVWNLQRDDDCIVACSTSIHEAHKDAISQVSYVQNPEHAQKEPLLVTSGSDGVVIVWAVDPEEESLNVVMRFQFTPYVNKRSTVKGTFAVDLGVTCFSFNHKDPSEFIVGVEGGNVLKCSLTKPNKKSAKTSTDDLDPVKKFYKGHIGTVICVEYSKDNKNIFATTGVDRNIHVYNSAETHPINIIHCEQLVIGLTFWKIHHKLLLSWGTKGFIRLYNYSKEKYVPSKLSESNMCTHVAITSSAFNPKSELMLAVGDAEGSVGIWEVEVSN